MANENNQQNRQPSMRELANERMRKLREERNNSGERRVSSDEGSVKRTTENRASSDALFF